MILTQAWKQFFKTKITLHSKILTDFHGFAEKINLAVTGTEQLIHNTAFNITKITKVLCAFPSVACIFRGSPHRRRDSIASLSQTVLISHQFFTALAVVRSKQQIYSHNKCLLYSYTVQKY